MATSVRQIRTIQHDSGHGKWELARGLPDPRLMPYVHTYQGYIETSSTQVRRRELPSSKVPLIINFGPAFRVIDPQSPSSAIDRGSFAAGLHDSYTITQSTGPAHCIQVDFSPIGANLFFGLPMDTLSHREVNLHDVLGSLADELISRLYELPAWEARFDLLDEVIISRLAIATPPSRAVQWAWNTLCAPDNDIRIGSLADQIGWNQKHLISRFHEHIGLTPGQVVRILRFERAMRQIEGSQSVRWTSVAHEAGYYDQAHFIRDFRKFTGSTPNEYLSLRLIDGSGVIDR